MAPDRIRILESIFKQDLRLLFHICNGYPLPKSMYMDIIQESVLITLDKINKIKNDTYGGIRGYLIAVLKNKCIEYLSKEQMIASYFVSEAEYNDRMVENVEDEKPGPIQQLILGEEKRLHHFVMEKIKVKYRPVIELTFDGHKPGKIAEMLNKNPSTIREFKMKGLKEYKKIMNKALRSGTH